MPHTNVQAKTHSMIVAVLLGLVTFGCSANKVDWASRIGHYTYDQAVVDLGPPDKQATLSDGRRVADWMTRRGGARHVAIGPYYTRGHSFYGPAYPAYVTHQVPDHFLRLMFDSDGHLHEWKKLAR